MEEFITGIGGVFFKTEKPEEINDWFKTSFGLNINEYGKSFNWRNYDDPEKIGITQFCIFKRSSEYFGNNGQQFMINYIVSDLEKLMETLASKGILAVKPMETHEYGKFCWVEDPDGNRMELWEPQ